MCWWPQTSGYSYPRVVTNRIDVYPIGETWYIRHIRFPRQSTYATRTLLAGSPPYIATFDADPIELDGCTAPEKNAPDSTSQPDWVARGTHFNFSPNWTIEAVINTFNICLQGPTHRSLTDIGGGYNRDDSKFPHHSPRPFQLMILCFPLRPPPGLRLTIQQSSN
jgi:hypothetical protein